ncbi:hypothetical protein C8J56DRAFT_744956, partial [Mycena floridula]
LTSLMSTDWLLHFYQLTMAIGMLMIVVGYVGCFNLVNHSTAPNGPYVWLSLEVFLSLLRIALWGWNPRWDDTMIQMGITLTEHSPLVTTPQDLNSLVRLSSKLGPANYIVRKITNDHTSPESFLVQKESHFLGSITGFTGPFPPFKSEVVVLYHALVGQAD